MRLPYTVALVITGLALGATHVFPALHLTKSLPFSAFLPGLVSEAAFHIDAREFRGNWLTITVLAVPGVIASTVLVAVVLAPVIRALHLAPAFAWQDALILAH